MMKIMALALMAILLGCGDEQMQTCDVAGEVTAKRYQLTSTCDGLCAEADLDNAEVSLGPNFPGVWFPSTGWIFGAKTTEGCISLRSDGREVGMFCSSGGWLESSRGVWSFCTR
jgi:hypothetical protein